MPKIEIKYFVNICYCCCKCNSINYCDLLKNFVVFFRQQTTYLIEYKQLNCMMKMYGLNKICENLYTLSTTIRLLKS